MPLKGNYSSQKRKYTSDAVRRFIFSSNLMVVLSIFFIKDLSQYNLGAVRAKVSSLIKAQCENCKRTQDAIKWLNFLEPDLGLVNI